MGGVSSERDISLSSGKAVLESLIRSGYQTVAIDAGADLAGQLEKQRIDIAFVTLHGRWGEDGTVQGLLEIMGIPYTGTGVLGSALCMDKCLVKPILISLGISTPPYRVYRSRTIDLPLPFVVKPARGGSTIGISIVREKEEIDAALECAFRYDGKVMMEQYVTGREITVGIVNGLALPIVEVRPASGFYDFQSKYTKGMTEYMVPATLSRTIEEEALESALLIWNHLELAGCSRVDMIVDQEACHVIDINTLPGMTETSLVPKAWKHLGKTFDELVEEILLEASLKA